MKRCIYFLLILTGYLCSCGKKESGVVPNTAPTTPTASIPEATTGGLKGMISPVGAVVDITVGIAVDGKFVVTTIKPGADGSFAFKGLPKGSGGLTFSPAVGYAAPAGISVSVIGGKDTDLGTVNIPLTPGSLSGTVSPAGAASHLTIKNTNSSASSIDILVDTKTGSFKSDNIPVGTYTLSGTANFGYAIPPIQTVTITTAHNTEVGTIQVNPSVRGSISGSISPAGSVANVTATYVGYPATTYRVIPDASGAFKIADVIAGMYFVSVQPISGSTLYAPNGKALMVNESRDSNTGSIVLMATPPPFTISAVMDGSTYHNNSASATYMPDQQRMTINGSINGGSFTLNIDQISAPGEYLCSSTTGSSITFTTVTESNPAIWDSQLVINSWSTKSTTGTGVIKITAINEVNKTISGTFSGTLNAVSGRAGGQKTVTDGVLTNVPYK
jgi:hypothetical protein